MWRRGNTLVLLFGPAMTVVGVDFLSRDVFRGLVIMVAAAFITAVGSYNQWIAPKKLNKFWLILPALFTALGYFPLIMIGEKKEIYERMSRGFEGHKSNEAWDNFTLEAAKVTKYYLELTKKYPDRFEDEVSLLATAGLLDAHDYIEVTISVSQIISIAKEAISAKEKALIEFIINLETLVFKNYEPEIDIEEIREACFKKKADIEYVVQKVKQEYVKEREFNLATSNFMELPRYERFRYELGIKEVEQDIFIT